MTKTERATRNIWLSRARNDVYNCVVRHFGMREAFEATEIKMCSRLTRALGRIRYRRNYTLNHQKGRVYGPMEHVVISFSVDAWADMSEEDRRHTAYHEACHLVTLWPHGDKGADPHGGLWQLNMISMGVEPFKPRKRVEVPGDYLTTIVEKSS